MQPADEIVAIVDERNNVIGAARRGEMRLKKLPHRSTYVMVFNSQGELYVQKRSLSKDIFTIAEGVWQCTTALWKLRL